MRLLLPFLCILVVIVTIQASLATQSDTGLMESENIGRKVREAGRKGKRIAKEERNNVNKRKNIKRKSSKIKKGHKGSCINYIMG